MFSFFLFWKLNWMHINEAFFHAPSISIPIRLCKFLLFCIIEKLLFLFFFFLIIVSILQNHLTIVLYNILHFIIQHIKIIKNKSGKSERGRINYKTNLSQVWNNATNTIIFTIFFTIVELTSFLLLVLI